MRMIPAVSPRRDMFRRARRRRWDAVKAPMAMIWGRSWSFCSYHYNPEAPGVERGHFIVNRLMKPMKP